MLVGVLAPGRSAAGHALLQHSVPESGAVLPRAPAAISLTFTEQPEPALSVVRVLDARGRPVEGGPAQPGARRPLELWVPLTPLSQGVYTVTWRTVSRIDGHVAGGAFGFGVGVPPSPLSQVTNPPPSPLYVVSRLLLYAGLSGLLGGAVAWMLPMRQPPARMPRLWGLWAAAAVGVLLLGVAQARDAAVELGRLLRTPLGHALWWRAAPVFAAGPAVGAGHGSGRYRRGAAVALGALVGAAMLAQVASGHAGAVSGLQRWVGILEQWVHFIGVGAWVGALTALLAAVQRGPDDASVRWCSTGAAAALGAIAVTGALRAADALGSWAALLSTAYGRLVLVKTAFFVLIALLGAVARHLTAGAPNALRGLRRMAGAELLVAAGAVAVTAFMTGLPLPSATPPQTVRTVQAPGQPPVYTITISGGRTLSLYLSPGTAGPNEVHGTFVDARGRELELARAPEITAGRRGQPPMALPVFQEGPGHFYSDGDFGPGDWQLEIVATTRTGQVLRVRLKVHL